MFYYYSESRWCNEAHFLSALFVRVIIQRPNISSYREIQANCTIVLTSNQIQGAPELKNRFGPKLQIPRGRRGGSVRRCLSAKYSVLLFSLRLFSKTPTFPDCFQTHCFCQETRQFAGRIDSIEASCYGNFISLQVAVVIFNYWYTEVIGLPTVPECAIGNGRLRGATNC